MSTLFRFISISRVLIRYRLDSMILSTPLLKNFKPILYLIPWHYFPVGKYTRGERVRLALEELGPIFIKFGQTLSTRRDLLPDDIGDELAKLQDKCPAIDSAIAKKIIEESLGGSTEKLFSSFDTKPLASASIAQVHSAVTLDGEEVVVKVVRPNILKQIKRDVKLMYFMADLIAKHPDGRRLRPFDAVEEFETIILAELNMMTEASNASLLRKNFSESDLLHVPRVYWDLCRENILVTERIYGTPISNVEALKANNIDLKKLSEDGVKIFFTQVFKHNFFHADMHPGNIFVDSKGQYIGVDFGIMGVLSDADQHYLAENFLAFFNQDYKRVAEVHIESGWVPEGTKLIEFEGAIRSVCEPIFEKPLKDISFGQVLLSLFKEAKRFDISIQPQLLLLDKTLLNIEGLGRTLYPDLDLWSTAKPFLENIAKEKYNMKSTIEKIKSKAPEIFKEMPELPTLVLSSLKQLKNIDKLYAKQTKGIVKQLEVNAKKQTAAVFSGSFIILSGILATNSLWALAITSLFIGLVFWFRSR
ncbi:MAG: ubiquinone biosynthesis regulatory protein kinase UbiB [Gammaproteobacteria bacterium]|nr:ubiquinone biosynthesis regulatory protein kinase UbiB [Gammaproteobacteria bacterium]|tara:strand:+ start:10088 stop:11683 length:1596 start_codon:yes stop_codon:yes gene_type:complete